MRKQCGIWKPEDIENQDAMALPCVRREGHAGPHIDRDNDTWRNDAMASCTETNNEGQQCKLIPNHDQEHRFTSVVIPCGAHRRESHTEWPCIRPSYHAGDHQDSDGHRWSFPTLPEDACGLDVDGDSPNSRPCRLSLGHGGEHLDQCPSTVGIRGEGEPENYLIVQCDGPSGHGGVHHNEEHQHTWNPEGYPPAEPVTESYDARLTRLEEQPTLTELATSLGRIMERLNVVEENADRVVKIAENLRVRVPAAGHMRDTFAVTAMNNHLGKLIELLSERLPEPPAPRCGHRALSSSDLCELEEGHDGRHRGGISSWPREDGPQPCPVPQTCPATLNLGSVTYDCAMTAGHSGYHTEDNGDTWDITGL